MNHFLISEVKCLSSKELTEILAESLEEGFRHINKLIDDYKSGVNKFSGEDEALFECRIDNRIIGICGLNQDPYCEEGVGRVRRLYVLKDYRRYGVGRKLTEAVINKAKKHYRKLVLKTDNPNASDFYKTLGFKDIRDDDKITHYMDLNES